MTAYTPALVLLLAGCSGKTAKQPPITNIKLGDLAPVNPAWHPQPMHTAAFDFYTLELPPENISALSAIWSALYTKPLRPIDPDAMTANSFRLVFGESQMWQRIAAMLESAAAQTAGRTRLVLDYGQIDDVTVCRIKNKTKISWYAPQTEFESFTAPAGRVALKIKVISIAGARGVCDFSAVPVFEAARPASPDKTAAEEGKTFEHLAFTVNISPGDFLVIGPAVMPYPPNSLGSLFFTSAERTQARLYVIFCSGISD